MSLLVALETAVIVASVFTLFRAFSGEVARLRANVACVLSVPLFRTVASHVSIAVAAVALCVAIAIFVVLSISVIPSLFYIVTGMVYLYNLVRNAQLIRT